MVNSDVSVWKKRVEYLKQIVPDMKEIFQVAARSYWDSVVGQSLVEAAKENGCLLIGPPVESPHHEAEYRHAFAQASKTAQGCIVSASIENSGNKQTIVNLAREYRMPTFYQQREYVELGGLIAHDIGIPDLFKHTGEQTAQILKGVWPGSIPFYQPYALKLIINLKAADEIGVRIPQNLIARADEVID
jgi:putative ABC transport system substrate-binding protein